MSAFRFSAADLPKSFDPARAERTFERLAEEGYRPDGPSRALLESVFGNSAFLCRLALREFEILDRLFAVGPGTVLDEIKDTALAAAGLHKESDVMSVLRQAKRRAALAIALADIAGVWTLKEVTAALTGFADACVKGALRFALKEAAQNTELSHKDSATLEASTGLVVLAMGKHGAFELNYSSDIDIVVFYEAGTFPFRKRGDARGAAVGIVKKLVKLIAEVTADGYVFRVDLRLRPDAGATQIAISTEAAEAYYEEMGQNWERAALIKARACAGDTAAGARFLSAVAPFVWRRNLDFAAIEDIHSIKRQIHAHAGHSTIAVAGHNVKLGRGGIREIEFFVQTQQLILGGRDPSLRVPSTIAALEALRTRGHVSRDAADALARSYRFLRKLEHRLQMTEDEQTHTVPKTPQGVAHTACFMGFADSAAFALALLDELETVQSYYARLFERAAPLAAAGGSLVFTGVEDDPETLDTLTRMGFCDPAHVSGAIRAWHHGRIRATRSPRARELLTKLVPPLLSALAATAAPDVAFAQFDRFLSNLPAGVQLFSLLLARSELLRLIAEIMGSAPRLADHLGRSPATLDVLLDPDFLGVLPARAALDRALHDQLARARDYEGKLDLVRRFAKEQIFRVGVQVIEGVAKADAAGPAFANIAEAIIADLLPCVAGELAENAGWIYDGAFAVIAMGKLGGREMTAGSDLDLVFVYDAPEGVEQSDGRKPMPTSLYYARLAQRLIAALTVATAEGGLYEVDMRLRPTGNKGPVAVSLESFMRYHQAESWTWERMALTRARVIAGPPKLIPKLDAVVSDTLRRRVDWARLFSDAREMREKVAAQYPGKNCWDLKYAAGGLMDIEFIAQTLQLRHAHDNPSALSTNTIDALKRLSRMGGLDGRDAEALIAAANLQHALTQALRIALDGPLDADSATPGLKALLVRAGEVRQFAELQRLLADRQTHARQIFDRVLAG
ncbi:MAG: bifunctional [glutamine synthetase] adenylyltransferase/[glutamine synthetase]-adenylyl-L-tyrosine phosphorylase [Alphaproteobacteria bacterium]|nr:bifunctional [glutamine synthetase] adenylyltransferase/[glutamine synthetase]-adenylyl-L-tyrosine phosphorylase [Alphaproteobacteria bacterium]MDE2112543.1 bifunctional [glutamine synthetase] adenylyltransferase/[glutamine synthetase]-adenylyl-L-tyrosine phosphorylase [Alphaproteobacteria bacterium]MDE2492935.1 bifunctional [glutamine synthetase] adenylyltransferase/[glutamine synthetase]-adenylyl-L-tyrosine phosphorylase [Alphaproteobacteria bacterium]